MYVRFSIICLQKIFIYNVNDLQKSHENNKLDRISTLISHYIQDKMVLNC
jgi:hypothetical protein